MVLGLLWHDGKPQHADTPKVACKMKPTSNYANHLCQKAAEPVLTLSEVKGKDGMVGVRVFPDARLTVLKTTVNEVLAYPTLIRRCTGLSRIDQITRNGARSHSKRQQKKAHGSHSNRLGDKSGRIANKCFR
jgi:hypothetical protein